MGLGDIIQGAAGGALGGSTFGPGGTILGGLAGGLGGFFGGNAQEDQRKRQQSFYDELSRGGPQSGPAFQGDYSGFRDNQKNLITQLEAMAQGRGPSLASEQLKAATDRNISQQIGLAQSGAGNPAAAAMMAGQNAQRLGAQAAQDSGQARIQEQMGALDRLGLNLHGARDADEGMNRFNAGQSNQNQWNNLNANLDTNRLRGMTLGGMDPGQQPSLGERILSGGAGMFGMRASQNAANKGGGGFGSQGYETWTNPNAGPRY